MISLERAYREEQNGAKRSFIAPSSEELCPSKQRDTIMNKLLLTVIFNQSETSALLLLLFLQHVACMGVHLARLGPPPHNSRVSL